MQENEELISRLQARLDQAASAKTKEWWERYMRQVVSFRGVGIPEIRRQLAHWRDESGIAAWANREQLGIALQLFDSPLAEDKLAGILFLQQYLYDQFAWEPLLGAYERLYAEGLIFDWNTCDWFCVRVLGPTIAQNGLPCARAIAGWRHSLDLWQARSSVVAFVPIADDTRYYPCILDSCRVLIRREERFAKTAVGWILREISRHDQDGVKAFVETHLRGFSLESLRNALKYASREEQQRYVSRLKAGEKSSGA